MLQFVSRDALIQIILLTPTFLRRRELVFRLSSIYGLDERFQFGELSDIVAQLSKLTADSLASGQSLPRRRESIAAPGWIPACAGMTKLK